MRIFLQPSKYVQDSLENALQRTFPESIIVDSPTDADLQWAEYEDLDFEIALANPQRWINSYCIRKALIRKHFLSNTIHEYTAKRLDTILHIAVPPSWTLEVDFVEFLDDALDEAFELRGELELNSNKAEEDRRWYILKPGMAERGSGLRLFSTMDQLVQIFEENEPDDAEDVEHDDRNFEGGAQLSTHSQGNTEDGVVTSDMRFFVVQEYMSNPLLLSSLSFRKFHIRAYVLCVGSLKVFLHRNLLLLCSAELYQKPSFERSELGRHLTNTCYQMAASGATPTNTVHSFWMVSDLQKDQIWEQLQSITSDLFDAACGQRINFQTIPNAFEIFGLDFLVDQSNSVQFLEVNAFPDFAQTGNDLKYLIDEVIRDTVDIVARAIQGKQEIDKISGRSGYVECLGKRMI